MNNQLIESELSEIQKEEFAKDMQKWSDYRNLTKNK